MSARAAVAATPYGDVDAAALEALKSSYDTTRMLAAVSSVEEVRARFDRPEGLSRQSRNQTGSTITDITIPR